MLSILDGKKELLGLLAGSICWQGFRIILSDEFSITDESCWIHISKKEMEIKYTFLGFA